MKMIIVLITACIMQVSASTFAQKLSYTKKGASLGQIFKEIKKQTGYNVFYSADEINDSRKIDVNFKDTELKEVLDVLATKSVFEYAIDNKNISIKAKTPSFLARVVSAFSTIDVTGRIVDESGAPLPGATIKVKGKDKVTRTNSEGEFRLTGVDENAVLEISYIGYVMQEVKAEKNVGTVRLKMGSSDLREVEINKGYYKVSKRFNLGAVAKVMGEDIAKQPITNPILALQGRAPGVYIEQSSGIPGGGITIKVRGQNSLANDNNPLYIVDGVPFPATSLLNFSIANGPAILSPFSSINSADIESIEVLKDAEATAIYGSRGANGVVLVTTKKPKAGRTQVDANFYTGSGFTTGRLKLLNTPQYLELRREAFKNDGVTTIPSNAYDVNGVWDTTRYTNWQDVFFGNTTSTLNGQLSISGGSESTQFSIRGGYSKETPAFPRDYPFVKGSSHLAINHITPDKKLNVGISVSLSSDKSSLPLADLTRFATLAPNAPPLYDSNGKLNWANDTWVNPLAELEKSSKTVTDFTSGSGTLSYKLFKGLRFDFTGGYSKMELNQENITPLSAYSPSFSNEASLRSNSRTTTIVKIWNAEPQFNYHNDMISNLVVDAMIGGTFQGSEQTSIVYQASTFSNDALISNPAASTMRAIVDNTYSEDKYLSFYGRVNLNYGQRYLLSANIRKDGSSRFGSGKRFGNFGSISAGWLFSEESFIKNNFKPLSFGKIRASYGTTGSQPGSPYQYLSRYSVYTFSYTGTRGFFPSNLANENYRWERVKKAEVGLELGFFKNRINFSGDYYRNITDNQLVGYTLPLITGFSSVQANLPATIRNEGLELDISSTNFSNKHFTWKSAFNISFPRNKLVAFQDFETSSYANDYILGEPISSVKRFKYTGIDQQTGLYTFQDVNNDGAISYPIDNLSITNNAPKCYGTLSNSFTYKNITLEIGLYFVRKRGYNAAFFVSSPGFFNSNLPTEYLTRWTKTGDVTNIQKISQSGEALIAYSNYGNSDDLGVDASFVRLKTLSLSYQLPESLLKSISIRSARVFFNGNNLLTFTKYKGLDPEMAGAGLTHPPLRMLTAGFNIGL